MTYSEATINKILDAIKDKDEDTQRNCRDLLNGLGQCIGVSVDLIVPRIKYVHNGIMKTLDSFKDNPNISELEELADATNESIAMSIIGNTLEIFNIPTERWDKVIEMVREQLNDIKESEKNGN